MSNQLHLTALQLKSFGFIQKVIKTKSIISDEEDFSVIYKKETLNGYFYYNPLETLNTWYHKTIIGEHSNDVNLDIKTEEDLVRLLNIWKRPTA